MYIYLEKYEIPCQEERMIIPYWGMCDHSWRRMIHGTVTHVVGGLTVNSEPLPSPSRAFISKIYAGNRIPCLFMPRQENHDGKGTYKNRGRVKRYVRGFSYTSICDSL